MIIHTFVELLLLGLIFFLYQGVRFQKWLLYVAITLFAYVGWKFYGGWQENIYDSYSFIWLSSKSYPVNIDFFSNPETYAQIFPFFCLSALICFGIMKDKHERKKLTVISLTILNLAALVLLICGQNTLQILIATCFIDVLGFCFINDMTARRLYIFYNLLADLGMFAALAMLWGENGSNDLTVLQGKRIGDIPLGLMVIVICLKSGLFPFQGYYLHMTTLTDCRRNLLTSVSTPVSGLLILLKFMPLFAEHAVLNGLLNVLVCLSLMWDGITALAVSHLNNKKIYLSLLFYVLAFAIVLPGETQFSVHLGKLLIIQFLLNNILQFGKKYLAAVYCASILLGMTTISEVLNINQFPLPQIYLTIFLIVVGSILDVLSTNNVEEQSASALIIAAMTASYLLYTHSEPSLIFWGYLIAWGILLIVHPYRWLPRQTRMETADGWSWLLQILFMKPVEFLGRILWLTIDFLIIERTLLSALSKLNSKVFACFEGLHQITVKNVLLFLLIGGILITYCMYGEKLLWK